MLEKMVCEEVMMYDWRMIPELWGAAKQPKEAGAPKGAAPKAGEAEEAGTGPPKLSPLTKGENAAACPASAAEDWEGPASSLITRLG